MSQALPIVEKNILFVCLGNICRSPIAEGLFRKIAAHRGLADQFHVDSAGLGSWHIGSPPDDRAQNAMLARGVDISELRARRVVPSDFESFDLILAMDRSNRNRLLTLAPVEQHHKIALFMSYAPNLSVHEIPDPFFGDLDGFDYACQLIDAACRGLLVNLTAQPGIQMTPAAKSSAASMNG